MPRYKNVTVEVTNTDNVTLREYGKQKRDRSGLTTCYIQSVADMKFYIRIKPTMPWPDFEKQDDGIDDDEPEDEGDYLDELARKKRGEELPWWIQPNVSTLPLFVAPWHLLASMRLDGRKTVEKKTIIYLDTRHPAYHFCGGEYVMRHRTYRNEDNKNREYGWRFTEVGIESAYENMLQDGFWKEGEDNPSAYMDEILRGMKDLDGIEEKSSVGQIEVTLSRITVGKVKIQQQPTRLYEAQEAIDVSQSGVSHTTVRQVDQNTDHAFTTIGYELVDPDEQPYATFKFYYRSGEQLRKFNFPDFAPRKTPAESCPSGPKWDGWMSRAGFDDTHLALEGGMDENDWEL